MMEWELQRLARAVVCISLACFAAPALAAEAEAGDSSELRAYYAGNGFLNRGLYDLAADEYRAFLAEHADHEKAGVARYGLAVSLYRLDKHADAAEQLDQLKNDDDFAFAAEVLTLLGRCRLALDDETAAAEAFARVAQRHEGHKLASDATAGLAEALYGLGRYDDAIKQTRRLVSRWPNGPLAQRALYFEGLSQMAAGRYGDAAKCFDAILVQDAGGPFAEHATLLLAQCNHQTQDLDRAAQRYRQAMQRGGQYAADATAGLGMLLQQRGESKEAGALLDQFLNANADHALSAAAKFHRARAHFDAGEFDRAQAIFEQVAGVDGELRDDSAYWAAKCRLRQEDAPDAATRLRAAIAQDPGSDLLAEMRYDLAVALVRGDAPDEATTVLREFLDAHPEHELAADAVYLLATTAHQQRRYDDSLEHCRTFLARHGTHELAAAAAYLAAENEFLAARYDEARQRYVKFLRDFPEDAQASAAQYRLGMALYHLGQFDDAKAALTPAAESVANNPAFRPALLALGDMAFQGGDWVTADARLVAYLKNGSDAGGADDALLKLGLARQRQERYAPAIEAFDELIARFAESPHRLQATFERGQALLALGELDRAAEALQRVLDEGGESRFAPFALHHLGAIATRRGQHDEAAKLYARAAQGGDAAVEAEALLAEGLARVSAGEFDAAQEALGRFCEQHGEHARVPEAAAQRAIALSRLDRRDDALHEISRVEKRFADRLSDALRAALFYEKAWCLRQSGDAPGAGAAYRELLQLTKDDRVRAHAMLGLAEIEAESDRHEQAAGILRELHRLAGAVPADVREQALYRLGVCEFELQNFDASAGALEELIREYGTSGFMASACYFCGESHFRAGRHDAAAAHFSRVVEQHASDAAFGPSLLRLGESLAQLQRWARSEEAFSAYLSKFPDTPGAHQAQFGVGWARENQSRHEEAIAAYRTVTDGHNGPTAARAQFQIGECLFAQSKYEDAIRELLKVDILFAYPQWSAAALFEAGRCFEKLGRSVEARNQFRQVDQKYPDTEWATMARQQLGAMADAAPPGK